MEVEPEISCAVCGDKICRVRCDQCGIGGDWSSPENIEKNIDKAYDKKNTMPYATI